MKCWKPSAARTAFVVGSFGRAGRNAGEFHYVHVAKFDLRGNLYTGEVDTGKRLQKWVPVE